MMQSRVANSPLIRAPRPGEVLRTTAGDSITLGLAFGHGGQGRVYAVEGDTHRCVKIALVPQGPIADARHTRFARLAHKAKRLDTTVLVLPTAVLARPALGYAMHRVNDAVSLSQLAVLPRGADVRAWYQETGGLRRRLLLAHKLIEAFRDLHIEGLNYGNLPWDNVLIPQKGPPAVHLIDCDNLSVDGAPPTGIQGTPWFIAPEVVAGTQLPDAVSDTYSLAVLLYHLLVLTHPLLGDRVRDAEPEAEQEALAGRWPFPPSAGTPEGGRLPWVDHPTDPRNRTLTGLPRALVISPGLDALFQKTFDDGLLGPSRAERPPLTRFTQAVGQAVDATVQCPGCAHTYYIRPARCPWCDTRRPPHWVLLIPNGAMRRPVVVQRQRQLYSRHLHGRPERGSESPLAKLQADGGQLILQAQDEALTVDRGTQTDHLRAGEHARLEDKVRFKLTRLDRQPLWVEVKRG